nr:hypothetical protein [Tanacetum cinerariifolium]
MVNLTFVDSHNMVAYLEKSAENANFAEIVDFLNANPIRYALTIVPIPTVSSSSQPKRPKNIGKPKRKATKISQSSRPTTLVADETIHEERADIVERVVTTAASLDTEQDSGTINKTQSRTIPNEHIPQGTGSGVSPRRQDTILGDTPAQTRFEMFSKQSHEPPLSRINTRGSGEDKENQEFGKEEKVKKSTTQEEDVEIQGRYGHDTEINTASTSITTAIINITTDEPVTTVSTPITTAGISVSTAEPKKAKERGSKEKSSETATRTTRGVIIKEGSETTTRPTVPPQQKLDPKYKGKGKMVEPEKPLKKKDQIEFDEEVVRNLEAQLQAELEEEKRLARQKEEESNIALIAEWDAV